MFQGWWVRIYKTSSLYFSRLGSEESELPCSLSVVCSLFLKEDPDTVHYLVFQHTTSVIQKDFDSCVEGLCVHFIGQNDTRQMKEDKVFQLFIPIKRKYTTLTFI